jgi:hypothetical protein
MDVVVFRLKPNRSIENLRQSNSSDDDTRHSSNVNNDNKSFLGAIQENGRIALLSVWTDEPVFGQSLEFVVDEVDLQGYSMEEVLVESVIPQTSLSYGSRQVGGGKGPGNPHGEESEILYYVEQPQLEGIEILVRPHLEILW